MIWYTDGSKIDNERLEPLGLTCCGGGGGGSDKQLLGERKYFGELTFHVFNKDRSFDFEVSFEKFKNIDKIYKEWIKSNRKYKLIKLDNGR